TPPARSPPSAKIPRYHAVMVRAVEILLWSGVGLLSLAACGGDKKGDDTGDVGEASGIPTATADESGEVSSGETLDTTSSSSATTLDDGSDTQADAEGGGDCGSTPPTPNAQLTGT